jgi:hypothetical protein
MLAMMTSSLGSACGRSKGQEAPAGEETTSTEEQVTIRVDASIERKTLDELIAESTLIVIGELETVYPSRWSTADGKFPTDAWIEDVMDAMRDYTIYTEVDILVTRVLKGELAGKTVRVRTFGGQVGQVRLVIEGYPSVVGQVRVRPDIERYPSFEFGRTFLLFLHPDAGLGCDVGAEHLTLRGAIQGMFTISDGKAISIRDEFPLDELLARIQEGALWTPAPTATFSPDYLITKLRVDVVRYIRHGQIDASLEESLLSELSAAYSSILKGESNTTIHQLEAFINEMRAQRGEKIAETTADDLITKAQAIIAALSHTPTPTSTDTPTVIPTDTPIKTSTDTPTPTPTAIPTDTLTSVPTDTPTPTASPAR